MMEKLLLTWSRRMRSISAEIVIDERRRLGFVGALLDVGPQIQQEAQVGAQLLFRRALGGGAHDEAAGGLAALVDQNPLEALALFVGRDLAADADVRDGGHEDQEAAGQGDVRGDARALLGDGLLGDLNENLLARLQQIADDRQVGHLHRAARGAAASGCPGWPALPGLRVRGVRGRCDRGAAGVERSGGGLAFGCWLFVVLFVVEAFLVAVLVVEVQLDAVVEVGLLEHLAQVAGANLRGQRLLFKVVRLVVSALGAVMRWRGASNSSSSMVSSSIRPLPGA